MLVIRSLGTCYDVSVERPREVMDRGLGNQAYHAEGSDAVPHIRNILGCSNNTSVGYCVRILRTYGDDNLELLTSARNDQQPSFISC